MKFRFSVENCQSVLFDWLTDDDFGLGVKVHPLDKDRYLCSWSENGRLCVWLDDLGFGDLVSPS